MLAHLLEVDGAHSLRPDSALAAIVHALAEATLVLGGERSVSSLSLDDNASRSRLLAAWADVGGRHVLSVHPFTFPLALDVNGGSRGELFELLFRERAR